MNLENYYWYFQSALDDETCDRIIAQGHERLKEIEEAQGKKATIAQVGGRSSVYNHGDINTKKKPRVGTTEQMKADGIDVSQTYARDSYVAFFSEDWVYETLHPYLHEANNHSGWNFTLAHSEQTQFTRYEDGGAGGEGQFYGWHMDGQWDEYKFFDENNPQHREEAILKDENNNEIMSETGTPVFVNNTWTTHKEWIGHVRKLSMTVQLTDPDEYEGGLFQIDRGPHFDIERYYTVREIMQRGSIIVFPSFVYHQVTPVTKGARESLVMWSIGPRWK